MAANPERSDATRAVEADEVQSSLRALLSAVSRDGERLIVEEDGVPVAALISLDDFRELQRFDARREQFFAALERIGAAFSDEDPDESDRLAALAVQEAREQMRRERAAQPST